MSLRERTKAWKREAKARWPVRGHDWHVWFARDTPDATDLYGPFLLGLATTLMDTFKLVRSSRALGEWAGGSFSPVV